MRRYWLVVAMAGGLVAFAPRGVRAQSTATAAMVTCKDSTKSKAGQGACSHHGGVATAATAALSTPGGGKVPNAASAAPPVKLKTGATADSTGAIAQCNDGMFWDGTVRSGACSGHKGVKRWLPAAPAK
jgi:hypothetical protein